MTAAGGRAVHGVLLIDKARGPTSHDVVAQARKALGTRAIGHAGTLDPMATGVLVLAVGEATKLLRFLALDDKIYEATVVLGVSTDTLDAEGAVTARAALPQALCAATIAEAAATFLGRQRQQAPAVSAIKVGGRPLYERFRRGESVEAPVRDVVVHSLEVRALDQRQLALRVACGKGFYVRALARDLALALGTVGHVTELRRIQSGPFGSDAAIPFASLMAAARGDSAVRARLEASLLSLEAACAPLPRVVLSAAGCEAAWHGRPIGPDGCLAGEWPPAEPPAELALFDGDGRLVALARRDGERLHVLRGIRR